MKKAAHFPSPFWARLVSTVLHPLVMPLFTLLLLFISDPYLGEMPGVFTYLCVVVFINTLAPAVSLYFLYKRGVLSDLEIRNRGERSVPFLIVLAYFVLTYLLFTKGEGMHIPDVYIATWVGLIASIAGALIITQRFKISMHMLGQGGALGTVMAVQAMHFTPNFALNAILLLLAGLVGWSRLEIGVHRHVEVYCGFLFGFLVCYTFVFMGWGA